ncbi:MAG: ArsR/SmtB family transcription factor [Christensenellales bacterium]
MIISEENQYVVDPRSAGLVLEYMPDGATVDGLCGLFSALGDGTRLRILSALSVTPLCVSDIVKLLRMNQTTVSHQLARLMTAGAVKRRRQGRITFYLDREPQDFRRHAVGYRVYRNRRTRVKIDFCAACVIIQSYPRR